MNPARTAAGVAGASALVYALYLSRMPFSPPSLLSPDLLALAVVSAVAIAASVLYIMTRERDLEPFAGTRKWVGWIPFSGGLLIYMLGTYSGFPDFLHWVSLWLLLEGVAVLLLGMRSWDLIAPTLSLLLLVVPGVPYQVLPLESVSLCLFCGLSAAAIALSHSLGSWVKPILVAPFVFGPLVFLLPAYVPLGGAAASAVLGCGSLVLLRRARGRTLPACTLHSSRLNAGRSGCVSCGRRLNGIESPGAKGDAVVLATIALVVLAAWSVVVPVVAVTKSDVNIGTVGVTDVASSPYLTAPPGFLQNSSAPSPALEKLYGEQLVVVKHFYPAVRPENFSYTLYVEAASSHAFLVKHWEYLGGYNRTTEDVVANGSIPITVHATILRSSNGSVVAISYEVPATVMLQGRYVGVYVGVSALAYPSFNLTKQGYEAIKARMIQGFVAPQARLIQASSWTGDIYTTISTVSSAAPFISLGGGAALIAGITGAVLNSDRSEQSLLDSVDSLDHKDKGILATALRLRMHSAPKTGNDLLSAYRSRAGPQATAPSFFRRLLNLEKMGLIKQEPVIADGRLTFQWRLAIT
ncbi:MAG TPA: hypothetical protein VKF15_05995 [Nitrososphaerales archaeon]|nr:hypothetical protein [Nitrososphaerales archaeon]